MEPAAVSLGVLASGALLFLAAANVLRSHRGAPTASPRAEGGPEARPDHPRSSRTPTASPSLPEGTGSTAPEDAESMTAVQLALFAHENGLCGWCQDSDSDPQFCPGVLEAVDEDATEAASRRLRERPR